jgi:hypothetical protein
MIMCQRCGECAVSPEDDYEEHCAECLEIVNQNRAEAAWESSQEGECFRGGEAAAYEAEQQERARRLK